ncbi:PDZ domain-containing protein [Engelhardtia mirabilis]|uniref:PDZ domain-containing protein n=1 Tax=Engelhardtia mirabilis TaxID=2528011 RepID=A0A518BK38_9BACT|nr:hypothetical protein Pla133_24220 [Planctomycetes bacterium Pla133]QDV01666.1 hypothetical protein Pla86_24210 [Planctomycetes bacterium Pla86]
MQDLDQREANLDATIARAQVDPRVRGLIEELAAGEGELAWTARMARRELGLRADRGIDALWSGPFGAAPFGTGGGSGGIFSPFSGNFAPLGGGGASRSPFGALEELQSQLDALFAPGVVPPGGSSTSESFSMRLGPDGVELELRTNENGEESIKTYRGDDLEELLEQQPELRAWVGNGSAGIGSLQQRALRELRPPVQAQPLRTDILGVLVTDSPATGTRPAGLVVHDTVPGTIAHLLGVTSGDLLLEINSMNLSEVTDISRAMASRGDHGEVRVRLIGTDGVERTRVWRPEGS